LSYGHVCSERPLVADTVDKVANGQDSRAF